MNDKESTRPTPEQINAVRQDALNSAQHPSVGEYFQRLGTYTLAILDDYERLLAQEKVVVESQTTPAPETSPRITEVDRTVQAIVAFLEQERHYYTRAGDYPHPDRAFAKGARYALGMVIGRLTGIYPEE